MPFSANNSATFFDLIIVSSVLWWSIFFIRKTHAQEIYLIWYVASLFFTIFFLIDVISEKQNLDKAQLCGAYESKCRLIYEALTSLNDEAELILFISTVIILPQILTYILSAISGSASPPKFISHVLRISLWSFVKFSAGLSGILAAEPLSKLAIHKPADIRVLLQGYATCSVAFLYAAGYSYISGDPPAFYQQLLFRHRLIRSFVRIHRFFTRHSRK